MSVLDSAFYTNSAGTEVVWSDKDSPRFYVVRNGEMRIHAKRSSGDFEHEVIRYTDQLESFGIKSDEELKKWTDRGNEFFIWVNNSWFEIYDTKDSEYSSHTIRELDEAVEFAKEMQKNFGDEKLV
jgi:hypothetical protein